MLMRENKRKYAEIFMKIVVQEIVEFFQRISQLHSTPHEFRGFLFATISSDKW